VYVANKQMENDLKHEGYMWIVRRDQPCPDNNACTTDFRLQFHGIFGAHDAIVRWHSFSFEGRVCNHPSDPSTCGIFRTGGWADFGRLFVTAPDVADCSHDVNEIYIPLPADTLYFPLDRPEARDEVRCHPNIQTLPQYPASYPLMEWWAATGRMRFQIRSYDPIGNIRQDAPDQWLFHCTLADLNCRYDQTITSAFIGYLIGIPEFVDNGVLGGIPVDSDGNGRTDYSGWTDRFSSIKQNCTQVALDCIPLQYDNIVLNFFSNKEARYFHHPCESCAKVDYDISPAGKKWNTWFFTKYTGDHNNDHTPTPTPPEPTPTPPTGAAIVVEVSPTNATQGQTINVALKLYNVSDVYGLQSQCSANPAILTGTTRTDGDGFNGSNSFFVDNGFQPDGKWLVAASRIQPNTPISGNATAFTLGYNVVGSGNSDLSCAVLAVDENGNDLNIEVINSNWASPSPIVTEDPTVEPTDTMPTLPPPTNTPDPAMLSTISGIAQYQNHPDNAGIKVELYLPDQTKVGEVMTGADGQFSFSGLAIGTYGVLITAPQHISSVAPVTVDANGTIVDAGTTVLSAGDTDDNGVIDIVDATFIGANFGLEGENAPSNADLNSDNIINISDLALVGGNYGLQSPVPSQ
jgi:hypothetical protein